MNEINLICPNCKKNPITRIKSKGRLPNCEKCKSEHKAQQLKTQREKRASGIWDAHTDRKTKVRYGTTPVECIYCKDTFINKRRGKLHNVCNSCITMHKIALYDKSKKMMRTEWYGKPEHTNWLRTKRMLKRVGISEDIYKAIQYCAICGTINPGITSAGTKKRWVMDHDHKCCKVGCEKCVRGFLCQNCNIGMGHFKDNIESMEKAIVWLKNGGNLKHS